MNKSASTRSSTPPCAPRSVPESLTPASRLSDGLEQVAADRRDGDREPEQRRLPQFEPRLVDDRRKDDHRGRAAHDRPRTNPSTLLFGEIDGASGVRPKSEPRMWAKVSPRNVPTSTARTRTATVLELSQEHAVRQRGADPDDAERPGQDGWRPLARAHREDRAGRQEREGRQERRRERVPPLDRRGGDDARAQRARRERERFRVAQEPHALERRERRDERHQRRPRRVADPQERRDHRGARNRDGQPPGQVAQAPPARCARFGDAHLRTLADG